MGEEEQAAPIVDGVFVKFRGTKVDGAEVMKALEAFGKTKEADSHVNGKRGYAIAVYEEVASAEKALEAGEIAVGDTALTVSQLKPAKTKEEREPRGPKKAAVPRDTSVYVKGMGMDFDEEAFKSMFKAFGEVVSTVIRRKASKRGPAVHAFVRYADKAGADAAVAAAESNPLMLGEDQLTVEPRKAKEQTAAGDQEKKTPPLTTVYMTNLKHDLSEEDLSKALATFGEVEQVTLRQRDCFASVEFSQQSELEAAHGAAVDGPLTLEGKELTVEPWKSLRKDEKLSRTLHVAGFGDTEPTEESVTALFAPFGKLEAVTVRNTRKFALVKFADEAAATACVAQAKSDAGLDVPAQGADGLLVELSDNNRKRASRKGRRKGPAADAAPAPAAPAE